MQGGKFDLQNSLSTWPGFPWSKYPFEKHAVGYEFLGPGTQIQIRIPNYEDKLQLNDNQLMSSEYIDNTFIPRLGDNPINQTDKIAMRHDLRYAEAELENPENPVTLKHEADRKMLAELEAISPATFGERIAKWLAYRIIKLKEKVGMSLPNEYAELVAKELHSPIIKTYPRRKIITNYLDEIHSSDLAEMHMNPCDHNYKFILVVIDNWSKYLWCIPLKSKSGETVSEAFKALYQTTQRIPKYIFCDHGKEYYNSNVRQVFNDLNINIYSTNNEPKAAIAERVIRTLKERIEPLLTEQELQNKKKSWLSILPQVVRDYNTSYHSTIKMTPEQASKKESQQYLTKLYFELYSKRVKDKNDLRVGDYVRLYKWKNKFEKSSKYRWTKELFKIVEIVPTNPLVYKVCDENGQLIEGKFYRQELLKSKFTF